MDSHAIDSNLNFYEAKRGLFSWIFTLDHKRIALLYLYSISLFFLVGVALGFLMRLELFSPGGQVMDPRTYNQVFTFHGVIMIFLVIIPSIPAVFRELFSANNDWDRRCSFTPS